METWTLEEYDDESREIMGPKESHIAFVTKTPAGMRNGLKMAAAPEMYEALRLMLFDIEGDPMALQFFDERTIGKAKAAVAKADGGRQN